MKLQAFIVVLALPTFSLSQPKPDHAKEMQAGLELFKAKVRPLLEKNCVECHGLKSVKGEVDLSTRETLLKSEALKKTAKESPLFRVVARLDEPYMPHKQPKLPDADIENLGNWIDLGAPYDKPLVEGKAVAKKEMTVGPAERDYWAFRKIKPQTIPIVKNMAWPKNPIDAFLISSMEAKGIAPAADIDRRGLIRRVYFDLVGLPPEPKDVEAFVNAPDVDEAYNAIVDKLLSSPHFGERWARHWLDAARYGESHGFEHDYDRPYAYHYRDFVIKAFNQDLRFDKFLQWQLAGDELAPKDPLALAATGFLGAGVYPTQITTSEAERIRYDAMDDMLATTGNAMLGLTVGCARCHDHKYDPIPTRDYYRMLSAFTTTVRAEVEWDFGTEAEKKAMRDFEAKLKPLVDARTKYETAELPKKLAEWVMEQSGKDAPKIADAKTADAVGKLLAGTEFAKLPKPAQALALNWFKPRDAGWKEAQKAAADVEKAKPKETKAKIQVCTEGVKPMRHHTAVGSIPDFYDKTFLLKRGDVDQKDGESKVGVLQVLSTNGDVTPPSKPPEATTSFRRIGLANWITDTDGGAGSLAARVIVNRLWHHHFGRGIVSTINDFGLQGEKPTHPELLEWLAGELVSHGWSLKHLHKLMVMSHAYRIGNKRNEKDPDNRLWSYRPARRLEAEIIRDNLLAVSGQLDEKMYGPGTLNEGMKRRSIYFQVKRSQMIPMMQVFDWPDSLTSAGVRPTTVIAPQALVFLNSPHVRGCAAAFAERLKPSADKSPAEAIGLAFRTAFARPASETEVKEGLAFLNAGGTWADYCLVLMGLNEFVFVN